MCVSGVFHKHAAAGSLAAPGAGPPASGGLPGERGLDTCLWLWTCPCLCPFTSPMLCCVGAVAPPAASSSLGPACAFAVKVPSSRAVPGPRAGRWPRSHRSTLRVPPQPRTDSPRRGRSGGPPAGPGGAHPVHCLLSGPQSCELPWPGPFSSVSSAWGVLLAPPPSLLPALKPGNTQGSELGSCTTGPDPWPSPRGPGVHRLIESHCLEKDVELRVFIVCFCGCPLGGACVRQEPKCGPGSPSGLGAVSVV